MKLCLVGCGRWGKAYLKTLNDMRSISINWIVLNSTMPKIEGNYNFVFDLDKLLKQQKVEQRPMRNPSFLTEIFG